MMHRAYFAAAMLVCAASARSAEAQSSMAPAPKPWGRVSFYSNLAQTESDGVPTRGYGEFTTSITYQMPDQDADGLDVGLDLRHSGYQSVAHPQRVSLYEAFVGARMNGGRLRARVGNIWLNDLGALGSVAGAHVEVRQPMEGAPSIGRLRVGVFGGLEPQIAEAGYAPDVKKFGGYVAIDGQRARRHVLGFVTVRNASLTERAVVTTTNFVPVGRKFFLYQAAEVDVRPPAGQAATGLSYFFTNARVSPTNRLDLQATYNRGRSIDTRGLTQDVLTGRPLTRTAIDGLLYESAGGRATVEVFPRVRVYAGYSRDKTNRDDASTGRTTIGGYAGNVLQSGFDISASDSLMNGPTRSFDARYVSIGRQIRRVLYVSGDYSTSLSVIHFVRSDSVTIELRPQTTRFSGNAVVNVGRATSLLVTVDRTVDDQSRDLRVLSGVTYRFR